MDASDLQVLTAPNPGPLTLEGTRTYLVGRRRLAVLDPGPADPAHLDALERAVGDRPVEAVCLTHAHPDHAALGERAAAALGAPLAASAETLRRLGLAGRRLAEGDAVPVDEGESALQVIETPGHSADHLCYLWTPSRRLFTGDLVLGRGSSVILYPDGQVGPYLASLARLVSLRPARILPGHGEEVPDAVGRLQEYRAHRLERERQILAALAEGSRALSDIRDAVYGELPNGVVRAADRSILAHLEHLRSAGHPLPEGLPRDLPEGTGDAGRP